MERNLLREFKTGYSDPDANLPPNRHFQLKSVTSAIALGVLFRKTGLPIPLKMVLDSDGVFCVKLASGEEYGLMIDVNKMFLIDKNGRTANLDSLKASNIQPNEPLKMVVG